MTEPATPTLAPPAPPAAPAKPSLTGRLLALVAWARSPQGRTDIGAVIAAVVGAYTALHRAGV